MSKSKKKTFKIGETVWVKAKFGAGTQEDPRVIIKGYCYAEVRRNDGGMDIATIVTPKQLKPDVTFPWSPAKAKKKGSKK